MHSSVPPVRFPAAAIGLALALTPASIRAQEPAPKVDPVALENLSREFAARAAEDRSEVLAWSARTGQPSQWRDQVGGGAELIAFRNGVPVVCATMNRVAADTISTDELWPGGATGLNLSGNPVRLYMWDYLGMRTTHQEFLGRVQQVDVPGNFSDHATHVAGTMVADGGANPPAQGMAYQAQLRAYDWVNDHAEMTAAAAGGAQISNHSYGRTVGWNSSPSDRFNIGGVLYYKWYGNIAVSLTEPVDFGLYDAEPLALDQIAFNAPSYLIVRAAGNDRGEDQAVPGAQHVHWDPNVGNWVLTNQARTADGGATGYDTLPPSACAKNVLTVGAIDDIPGGYGGPATVVQGITSFSSCGPTDDGRIKPDVVGNGDGLLSPVAFVPNSNPPVASNVDYGISWGTSMAAPNVSGTLGLLLQHYRAKRNNQNPLSSVLKALVIHTADEAGPADGPDYRMGWGLMNARKAAQVVTRSGVWPGVLDDRSIENGKTYRGRLPFPGGEPFRVTICWTDPAGMANTGLVVDPPGPRLVNDLDLRVTDPNGVVHFPWRLDLANPGNAATRGDNARDNVERVDIPDAPAGFYHVTVTHKGVLQNGPQVFALVLPMVPPAQKGKGPGMIGANPAQASPAGLSPAALGVQFVNQIHFTRDPALPAGFVRCALSTNLGLRTGIYHAALDVFQYDAPAYWTPLNVSGGEFGLVMNQAPARAGSPVQTYGAGTVAVWDYDVNAAQAARCATRASTSSPWTLRGAIQGLPAANVDPSLAVVRGALWLLWVEPHGTAQWIVGAPFDPLVPGITETPTVLVVPGDHPDQRLPHSPVPITGPDGDSELLIYDASLPNTTDSDPQFKPRLESSAPAFSFAPVTYWANNGGNIGGTLYQAYWPGSNAYRVYDLDLAMLTGDDESHTRGLAGRSADIGLLAPIAGPLEPPWLGFVAIDVSLLPFGLPVPPFANELVVSPLGLFLALPPVDPATGLASISAPLSPEFPPGTIHVQGLVLRAGLQGIQGAWTNNATIET